MVRAWVSIDKGERRKMNLTWQGLWYEAQTSIDIQNLPRGYHTAKITAIDDTSVFSKSFSFKVTEDASTPIGDLLSHPQKYLGKHPRIDTLRSRVLSASVSTREQDQMDSNGTVPEL
jgi:hypothetical protein